MRIAVTGAGGRIGGQVVSLLAALGTVQVVALARRELSPGQLSRNVVGAVADYIDARALRGALDQVDTLVLVSSDGPAAKVIIHHRNVILAAASSGVRHIVALSGLDADIGSPFCYAVSNGYTEQLLHDAGCSLSIARASLYTEFFLALATHARFGGQLRLPAGDGRVSLVSRADISSCLAALAVIGPTGRHHDITGPESLDMPTPATRCSHAWRTPITYVDIAPADTARS